MVVTIKFQRMCHNITRTYYDIFQGTFLLILFVLLRFEEHVTMQITLMQSCNWMGHAWKQMIIMILRIRTVVIHTYNTCERAGRSWGNP